jgi:hypothetical protein
MTFVNNSEDNVWVSLRFVPPDRIDELTPRFGTDFGFDAGKDLSPTIVVQPRPGEEGTANAFLSAGGTYVVDCTLLVGGQRSHIWWPAALEVTR